MDAGIILSGRSPNIMGEFARGLGTAQLQTEIARKNALAELYAQQGPQIMAGQPQALNALAAYDPTIAMGVQSAQLDQQATRQNMAINAEELQLRREAGRRQAEALLRAQAADLTAAQAAQYRAQMMGTLAGGAQAYQQGPQAFAGWLAQSGLQGLSYEQFPIWAATSAGELDALDEVSKMLAKPEAPKPMSTPGKINADMTAGFLTPDQAAVAMAPRGPLVQIGPGNAPTVGDTYNPADAQSAIDAIDAIASDPNLGRVTGSIMGGGGNNIDDLGIPQRLYYGDAGTALVEKIGQLQNVTWLSARQMLKGGGAITDYESRKAEGAVARLSRAKGETEFRAALKDLRDAISEGMAKLQATATPAPGQGSPASGSVLDDQTLQLLDPETRQWYLDFVGPSSN